MLLVITSVIAYPQILMAIPEPEKNMETVFNYDHVEIYFHNRFVWNKDDKKETMSYNAYITSRTGCIDFTVLGLQKSNHQAMHIMINCHDKVLKSK